MKEIAFVGDVHGSLNALEGILDALRSRSIERIVFLGDYVNKGIDSRAVLERLITESANGLVTLLRGNHEAAFLEALDSRDLRIFLKMGGAATVRSYVGGHVGPDAIGALLNAVPAVHIDALRAMPIRFATRTVVAQHEPLGRARLLNIGRFAVTAHRPVGITPRIGRLSAEIDTGCSDEGGRLTSFMWPSRECIQIGADGNVVDVS
ncbi:MAG: diadenosine tetraphosphatase [Microbacterium sp.]|nr:diadenosine tetraphosphatase [Microbacterium sp.]